MAMMRSQTIQLRWSAAGLFVLSLLFCVSSFAMSDAAEVKLGEEKNRQVIAQFGVYRDKELQEYVNRVGQRIAKVCDRPNLTYHFTIIDSPMVNAFAIPGGFVYVARGLLAELNSESELAGILGHEIAHITQRHALKKENRAKALQALSAVAEIATMTPGVYDVGNLASQGIIEGYSRDVELEADRIGAKYMAKAGYDPAAMMKTIDTLKAQERLDIKEARLEDRELDPTSFGWLASHPDNDTRYRQAIKQAHALEATYHEFIKSDEFLEKLNGLAYGPTHQVGVVRKDNFYDPRVGIKLAFPEGWHVESNPSGVQMVSAKRDAVLALSTGQYMAGVDGRQYVGKMGVKIRNGRDVNIGGMPGFIGIADHVQTPFGPRPVRLAVLFDTMRHITFIMTGAGKHDLHDIANDRDFIATIFSFGRMDRHDFEVAVRPRIQVVRAEKGTTMEALAKQSPISNYALDKLRLMNGMYPDGEPKPGQLIKIID